MINANFEGIERLASRMTQNTEDYRNAIVNIYNQVDSLAQVWQGADNKSYAEKINSYRPDMDELGNVLQSYGDFLSSTAQRYRRVQEEIAQAAKNI